MPLGKDCKLAFDSKDNIVASGTIVDINVPQQLLHNVPLGEGNIKVFVNYAINGASPLPMPVKGVLNTVEDAVGSQVAWPEDLIVFIDDICLTFHDLKSPDEAWRVQYIVKALNQVSIDSFFFIPYNPGGHWILTIIDEEKDNMYIMDPLGARHPHDVWKRIINAGIKQFNAEKGRGLRRPPTWIILSGPSKQADGKTCGYCVMRMQEMGKRRRFTAKWNWRSNGDSPKLKVNFRIVTAPMGEGPGETHKGLSVSVGGSRTEEVLTKLPETRTMEKALIDCVDVEQQLGLSLFSKVWALALLWQHGVDITIHSSSPGHIDAIIGGDVTGLWLVGGDFNEIIAMHEYLGRRFRVMSQIRDFGATLEDCGLSTVGFKGYKFTWSNRWRGGGNVKLSLDRMVANDLMFLAFPDMLTHHLNSVVLDHLPIFMGLGCIVGQGGSNALCSRNFEPQLKVVRIPLLVLRGADQGSKMQQLLFNRELYPARWMCCSIEKKCCGVRSLVYPG
ncbi:unnamed protein product [Prunus armeniaca]